MFSEKHNDDAKAKTHRPLPVLNFHNVAAKEAHTFQPTGVLSPMTDLAVNMGSLSTKSATEFTDEVSRATNHHKRYTIVCNLSNFYELCNSVIRSKR